MPAGIASGTCSTDTLPAGCGESDLRPLAAGGVTICLSCNIAVAIRIASPGDSGAVTQASGAGATAVANAATTTIQTAAPALPPAPPAIPVLVQPAPPASPPPAVTLPPVPLPPVALPPATLPPEAFLMQVTPPSVRTHLPRRSALARGGARRQASVRRLRAAVPTTRTFVVTRTRVVAVVVAAEHLRRVVHARAAAPASSPRRLPPPRPAPPAPAPMSMVPSAGGVSDGSGFTTAALGVGGLGAFLLVVLTYAAPGRRTVRSRAAAAHPDPPG